MRSVGIDIGRYSIKVIEIFANNRDYQITNAKEYRILNPENNDQEIDILQTLKEISKDFDTDTAKVTCSIRQQYVSTRKLFFPFKERVKIQKSLAFELEDDIPLAIDKAIYDSKIIKFHDKSTEVIAMACISEEIERTIDIMTRGHIDPDIITPEFCAIANLYENWDRPPSEASSTGDSGEMDKLVVQIGHAKTFVGVVSKKHMIWGRSIMWGAENIAASISQSFQVPFMTALDMMPDKSFLLLSSQGANSDQIKMSDTVAKSLVPLIQSLRLTMMLANTEYGANIDSIELLGGAGKIKNLAPYFTQELERSTSVVNPIDKATQDHIKNNLELDEVFQMSLGLAIEGLRRPFNPAVNFRQGLFLKKNVSFEKFWEKWGYTAKIIAAGYAFYFIYGLALSSVSDKLELASHDVLIQQAGQIAGLKGGSATHSKIRSYVKENRKKAELVEVYEQLAEINTPIKWINDISQILPSNKNSQNYEVRRLFVKDDEVNIQGVAKSAKDVANLEKALKGIALGKNVKSIPATIKKEGAKNSFAFQFKVKRKN